MAQIRDRGVAIYEFARFAAFGLSEASLDLHRYSLALPEHPFLATKLLPDNLEGLIEHFTRAFISPGLDSKIDYALLFSLQLDHALMLPSRASTLN